MKNLDALRMLEMRGLPANREIERLMLGSVLVDGADRMAIIRGALDESHFATDSHRRIWAALCTLHDGGKGLDRVSLAEQLQRVGLLEAIGGMGMIVSLDEGMPMGTVNVDGWLRILQEKAALRDAIGQMHAALLKCMAEDEDALSVAYAVAEGIAAKTTGDAGLRSAGDIIESIGYQEFCQPTRNRAGVQPPAAWGKFREILPVFRPGQLIIVAALTSAGKSTFTAQIAVEAARRGEPVAVFSMEMGADEILPRMVSSLSDVDGYSHANNWMDSAQRQEFQAGTAAIAEMPLYIDDRSTHTALSINAAIRRMRTRPKLVVVDYLQLMESAGRHETREQAVSSMSRSLKRMAGDLRIPVIALSQLNRKSAQEDRRPELHDLRDSGSIEQDANVVIFLHTTKANAMLPASPCDVIIAKQRGGRRGEVQMLFRKPTACFVEG